MEIDKIELELEEIGLTKSEIKVYLSLLKLGPSTSGPIIAESKTSNSKIYIVLNKLIEKGLITYYIQNELKYFKAVNPNQLIRYLQEKEEQIKLQREKVKNIIPYLSFLSQKNEESEGLVFKGPRAIRTAFNDVVDSLNKGEEVHIMGTYNFGEKFLNIAIYFQQIRSKKGVKAKFLINRDAKNVAKMFSEYPPVEIRFMKKGITTPAVFLIYKNKVIVNLGDDMTFFMMKSQRTADAFNVYFEEMWKTAKA